MKLKKLLKLLREDEKFVLSGTDTGSGGLVTDADAVLETMPYFWKYRVLSIEHDKADHDVEDLPTAADFPDWHLSAGSRCYILYQADKCFIMDCNGTWIERNLDIATSF